MQNFADIADQPVTALWGEHVRARRVQGERITFAVVELDPNADLPQHTHEAEQIGIVVVGRMLFDVGGEVRELGPGGTWRIPSMRPHKATAGSAGATVIDVFTPIRSDWDALPTSPASAPRWPRS